MIGITYTVVRANTNDLLCQMKSVKVSLNALVNNHRYARRAWDASPPFKTQLFTNSSLNNQLSTVDTFLFDCDGVVWRGDHPIDGAIEAIDHLRNLRKKIFFVTNNSTKSRVGTTEKFKRLGIKVHSDEVLTSSFAAALYLKNINFSEKLQNKAYVIGDVGIMQELTGMGIDCIGGPDDADKAVNFSHHFDVDPTIGALVVGLDMNLNYYKLQYGQLLLNQDQNCLFLATNRDAQFPNKTQLWPGAGSIVNALVGCTGREPVVVGKPSSILIEYLIKERGCDAGRMCMVGDRLDTDILFGQRHGMVTCLTMSGVTDHNMLRDPKNKISPNVVVNSIRDIPDLVIN